MFADLDASNTDTLYSYVLHLHLLLLTMMRLKSKEKAEHGVLSSRGYKTAMHSLCWRAAWTFDRELSHSHRTRCEWCHSSGTDAADIRSGVWYTLTHSHASTHQREDLSTELHYYYYIHQGGYASNPVCWLDWLQKIHRVTKQRLSKWDLSRECTHCILIFSPISQGIIHESW